MNSKRSDVSPYNQYLYSETSYGLSFTPGYPLEFSQIKSLTFHLISPYQNGPVNTAGFNLWNFESQEWEEIENLVWGDNPIPSPSKYVASTSGSDSKGSFSPGTVRLQVVTTNDYLEITASDFTLAVSR